MKDERFKTKTNEYLTQYKKNKDELIKIEKEFLSKSNELSFLQQKLSILNKIKKELKNQNPLESNCPACKQKLSSSLEEMYEYYQDTNDTKTEVVGIKEKIKDVQSDINNHYLKKIDELKTLIEKDYNTLQDYNIEDLSVNTWLNNKTYVKLAETIITKVGEKTIEIDGIDEELKKYKTEEEVIKERTNKDYEFKNIFKPLLESFLDERAMNVFNSNDNFLLL